MAIYAPPLAESLFVLDHVIGWTQLFAQPTYSHVEGETAHHVLEAGAAFATSVLAPTNRAGDEVGADDESHLRRAYGMFFLSHDASLAAVHTARIAAGAKVIDVAPPALFD